MTGSVDANVNALRRGFTLIELLVVMAVVALLLSLAAPRYFQHVERSREAVLKENLAVMRDAIDQFHADTGRWPDSLTQLVDRRYLRAVPVDPITESAQTWVAVAAAEAGGEEGGLRDVRSGAEGVAADGVPFGDW